MEGAGGTWRDAWEGGGGSERWVKLCAHRPAGGEVSTLPSTPATERTAVSRPKGGKLSGGVSMLPRLRRGPSPSCQEPRLRVLPRDFAMICGYRIEWKRNRIITPSNVVSLSHLSMFTPAREREREKLREIRGRIDSRYSRRIRNSRYEIDEM